MFHAGLYDMTSGKAGCVLAPAGVISCAPTVYPVVDTDDLLGN